jgi:hypothetical protein
MQLMADECASSFTIFPIHFLSVFSADEVEKLALAFGGLVGLLGGAHSVQG